MCNVHSLVHLWMLKKGRRWIQFFMRTKKQNAIHRPEMAEISWLAFGRSNIDICFMYLYFLHCITIQKPSATEYNVLKCVWEETTDEYFGGIVCYIVVVLVLVLVLVLMFAIFHDYLHICLIYIVHSSVHTVASAVYMYIVHCACICFCSACLIFVGPGLIYDYFGKLPNVCLSLFENLPNMNGSANWKRSLHNPKMGKKIRSAYKYEEGNILAPLLK